MKSHLMKAFILVPFCVVALTSCKHAEKNENYTQISQNINIETVKPIDFKKFKHGRKPSSVKKLQDARSWKGYLNYVFAQDAESRSAAAKNISLYNNEATVLAVAVNKKDQSAAHASIRKFQSYLINQSDRMDSGQYATLYNEVKNAERDVLKGNFNALAVKTKVLQTALSGFETYQDMKKLFE